MADEPSAKIEWPYTTRLPVLGIEVAFETDSEAVFDIINATYGGWASLATRPGLVSASDAAVRILARDPAGAPGAQPALGPRTKDGSRLLIQGDGRAGFADAERLQSLAHVSPEIVARPGEFVEEVLEPLTLFLLGALDRQPLHAAAVVRDGTAILLAGASGAGKSTLSYAACQNRFSLLADEPVYIQLVPQTRVWGRRGRLHLPVEATAHFPELRDTAPSRLPSGKTKIIVETEDWQPYAHRCGLCLLRHSPLDRPTLERIEPSEAVAELTSDLDAGFDLFAATIGKRIAQVASRGAWRVGVVRTPGDALPLLHDVADQIEEAG